MTTNELISSLELPLIQGGMVWASGHKLVSSCVHSGIIGTLGAASMTLPILEHHLTSLKQNLTSSELSRVAVNIPLLYTKNKDQIDLCLESGIKLFITSAGDPKTYTSYLKSCGAMVWHVTSSPLLAKKCEDAGVDAVIAEGFEAGGHNGKDQLTSMVLIPLVKACVSVPVIAAGGMSSAAHIKAALILGASAVQMGTRFLLTRESSAHESFKNHCLTTTQKTALLMQESIPVRVLLNKFATELREKELRGESKEELMNFLGKGRPKAGLFEGDLENGELEIGQVVHLIKNLPSVEDLIHSLKNEYVKLNSLD
jgi:enoyl-[acyl-carrier protein] reductase II